MEWAGFLVLLGYTLNSEERPSLSIEARRIPWTEIGEVQMNTTEKGKVACGLGSPDALNPSAMQT